MEVFPTMMLFETITTFLANEIDLSWEKLNLKWMIMGTLMSHYKGEGWFHFAATSTFEN